jgi:hypothetical protein
MRFYDLTVANMSMLVLLFVAPSGLPEEEVNMIIQNFGITYKSSRLTTQKTNIDVSLCQFTGNNCRYTPTGLLLIIFYLHQFSRVFS